MNDIKPNWPAPLTVQSLVTTRVEGFSEGAYGHNNLALHVGDKPRAVMANRAQLGENHSFSSVQWLNQTHGTRVIQADGRSVIDADGSWTKDLGLACAILTADCLPLLLCNQSGTQVAAIHAGWRGLAEGIVQSGVEVFENPDELMAYLGPAISQPYFEVGQEVKDIFQRIIAKEKSNDAQAQVFKPNQDKPGHYWADLYELVRIELRSLGVTQIYGGEYCTFSQPELFYSYRQESVCGRMASLIWLVQDNSSK